MRCVSRPSACTVWRISHRILLLGGYRNRVITRARGRGYLPVARNAHFVFYTTRAPRTCARRRFGVVPELGRVKVTSNWTNARLGMSKRGKFLLRPPSEGMRCFAAALYRCPPLPFHSIGYYVEVTFGRVAELPYRTAPAATTSAHTL